MKLSPRKQPTQQPAQSGEITRLLMEIEKGSKDAADKLMPLIYGELRQMAAGLWAREKRRVTLQPTILVHDALLTLIGSKRINWRCRAQFFAIAASAMRRIIVNHARRRNSIKRGAKIHFEVLNEGVAYSEERSKQLLALDDALEKLQKLDARQSQIVELKYFGGLTGKEIAKTLGISVRTVAGDWEIAKAWLERELGK